MKFSIVVPSFNQAQFVAESVESILSQQGDFEIECLVFDGGSTDGTVEVLKSIEAKLAAGQYNANKERPTLFWVSQKDKGQSDAINQGLKKATGDICAYLNSDDYYPAGCFQLVANKFQAEPKKIWLTGRCQIVDQNGQPIRSLIAGYKNFWLDHYSYRKLLVLNFVSQPATFWRQTAVKEFGYFRVDLNYVMDYEYWLRIARGNDPIVVQETVSNFRIHQSSKGQTRARAQFAEDLAVSSHYSSSRFLNLLHSWHNQLILLVYRFI